MKNGHVHHDGNSWEREEIRRLDNLRRRLSVAVAAGRMTAREAADLLVDEMIPSALQIRRR
ncbi:hypothetical protein caldi_11940 [Caldinitratiruptor microaerophilus]|uniref:Uncharacterized protein n=1 Tax=Caldinitratiruptor microaerophilus TaxID=671077 RepID=A0AA35CIY2_9FIRM|nr:hypothetical protein caldi_11940 [Caldinitratiruptor microaerophilus]